MLGWFQDGASVPRRLAAGVGAAAVIALVAASCGGSDSSTSTSATGSGETTATTASQGARPPADVVPVTGTLDNVTWNLPWGEPSNLDPLTSLGYAGGAMEANMCDTLVGRDPETGKIEPRIATSTSRPDPTTLVFQIREGVKFWNGHPLTAEDVAFSLRRNLDPAKAIAQYAHYAPVKSIEATGPSEVTVKFKRPYSPFEPQLPFAKFSGISEKAYVEEKGDDYGSAKAGIMCSGPFEFKQWKPGNEVIVTANKNYWDKDLVPKVNQVTFKFVTDPSAITAGLLSGTFDGSMDLPPASIKPLKNASAGRFYATPGPSAFQILPAGGVMKDVNVRKALNLIIDRPAIAKAVFDGLATPATELYPPWTVEGTPPEAQALFDAAAKKLPGATPDPEAAKAAFEAAGSPTQPIVLAVPGLSKPMQDMATLVQQEAKTIGMNIKLKLQSPNEANAIYLPDGRKGLDAVMLQNSNTARDPLDATAYFVDPDQALNFFGYDNPTASGDLRKAEATYDPVKRAEAAIAVQDQYIGKDQALIGIVYFDYLSFVNHRVGGYIPYYDTYTFPWAATLGAAG